MVRGNTKPAKKFPIKRSQNTPNRAFGPVSAVSSAPVAIGNSIRGTQPIVEYGQDSCRIRGRDFAFEMGSSVAAATGWTLVGGLPLTPCAMPSTSLKAYCQMFAMFRFNTLAVHYITSSPTSQAGDVLFYYEKDRTGPALDNTNTGFLPTVLSDSSTVLGPQWTNHTAIVRPDPEFKSTDYGMNADLNEEANGSVFVYSKTNAANSPGYVLIDYDITFKLHQSNPRAGLLPVARAQWTPICFTESAVSWTSGTTVLAPSVATGKLISGATSAAPTGSQIGDVYKVIFDVTNSTVTGVNAAWTGVGASTLLRFQTTGGTTATTIDDGFTCYAVINSGSTWNIFPTLSAALTATEPFVAGATTTATYALCAYVSLVGSVSPARLSTSY